LLEQPCLTQRVEGTSCLASRGNFDLSQSKRRGNDVQEAVLRMFVVITRTVSGVEVHPLDDIFIVEHDMVLLVLCTEARNVSVVASFVHVWNFVPALFEGVLLICMILLILLSAPAPEFVDCVHLPSDWSAGTGSHGIGARVRGCPLFSTWQQRAFVMC
jgi:hypothetical protein